MIPLIVDCKQQVAQTVVNVDEINDAVEGRLGLYGLKSLQPLTTEQEILSRLFFRLAIAYINKPQITSYYLDKEAALFKSRFNNAAIHDCNKLMSKFAKQFKMKQIHTLKDVPGRLQNEFGNNEFPVYLISFEHVLQMVGAKEMVLHLGTAYVSQHYKNKLATILYHQWLANKINSIKNNIPNMEETDFPPLKQMIKTIYVTIYKHLMPINITQQENFNVIHFPPCMRMLMQKVKELNNSQRKQLILFLKSIGVNFNAVINVFVNHNSYEKIKYDVKHLYGMTGAKKNYQPMCCDTITKNGNCIWTQHVMTNKNNLEKWYGTMDYTSTLNKSLCKLKWKIEICRSLSLQLNEQKLKTAKIQITDLEDMNLIKVTNPTNFYNYNKQIEIQYHQ